MNLIGLLLAAGRGRRMGGNKQFHLVQTPTGEKPLVAAAFDTIAPVCDGMIVVLGHRAHEVTDILKKGTQLFFECVTADPDAPMIDSIKAGLKAALHNPRPQFFGEASTQGYRGEGQLQRSILLQLGDHPALELTTLDMLLAVAAEHPDKAIMPTYQGHGGHPVLVPPAMAKQILAADCPGGLRQFWLDHPELCLRVPVNDDGVTRDIDQRL